MLHIFTSFYYIYFFAKKIQLKFVVDCEGQFGAQNEELLCNRDLFFSAVVFESLLYIEARIYFFPRI